MAHTCRCGDCGACETVAILADPEMMQAIREGVAAIACGDVVSSDELDEMVREAAELGLYESTDRPMPPRRIDSKTGIDLDELEARMDDPDAWG